MTFDNEDLGFVINPVKARVNKTAGAEKARRSKPIKPRSIPKAQMDRISRIANKTPEVMLKVSGGATGFKHMRQHMDYITRNGDVEAETEQGEILMTRDAVKEKAQDWYSQHRGGRRGRETVNLVLSMPPGTDPDKLKNAVRNFALHNFSADREYMFVRHDDTKHPHCHLTLKAIGNDGKRLSPRKADLQQWRESFAQCLRDQGVEAEATPRLSRGVVKKGEKQAVRHATARKASTVRQGQAKDAGERFRGIKKERPWEAKIRAQQADIRKAWGRVANYLKSRHESRRLAVEAIKFVKTMPKPVTQEQEVVARMQAYDRSRTRNKDKGRE